MIYKDREKNTRKFRGGIKLKTYTEEHREPQRNTEKNRVKSLDFKLSVYLCEPELAKASVHSV
jgi:hypothetical protein